MANGNRLDIHVHLPPTTVIRIALALLIGWALLRLWPEFVLLLVAIILAVALHPLVLWFTRRRITRAAAIAIIAGALLVGIVVFLALITTTLAEQISGLARDFPEFRARLEQRLPPNFPILRRIVAEIFALPNSLEVAPHLKRPLALGTSALAVAFSMFFTMIVTLYLLLDGKRLYAWLIAYVPRKHRDDVAVTAEQVSVVVQAYVRGQVVTSALFAGFTAILLTSCRVPAALPLALVAGFCDVIPMVGVVIATAPAVLLAFTVSPTVGICVAVLYVLYHLFESYYIVPRIYGSRLRLSTLAVLLALLVGNTLQGLMGAVLILPLVAAYPIIERIWLARYLSPEVIKDHGALAGSVESTNGEHVVETVLQGERHPWEAPSGPLSGPA